MGNGDLERDDKIRRKKESMMNASNPPLNPGKTLLISGIVFVILLLEVFFLFRSVEPLPISQDTDRANRSFEMVSVVLAMLAGGCMAAYFSFDYGRVNVLYKQGALFISWLFIGSIYLLTFLILYSMRKAGALHILDRWASMLLFLAVYAFLDGMVLFEFWKMGQFQQNNEKA